VRPLTAVDLLVLLWYAVLAYVWQVRLYGRGAGAVVFVTFLCFGAYAWMVWRKLL
jgi:hypothetical protein